MFGSAFSQKKYWTAHPEADNNIIPDKAVSRLAFPKVFKLFDLNFADIRQDLFSVTVKGAVAHSVIITIPNADGGTEEFRLTEASNFEPDLQAQFPDIRAFSGRGITDRYATIKLSIAADGIQTMVFRTDNETEFIEPYSANHAVYAVYRAQRNKNTLPWTCSMDEQNLVGSIQAPASSTGQLKTMRLAQSCNGEYANYFGATTSADVAKVLAAFNATITRCNGVFEKDLAIHLNLIAATTAVIYYDKNTDPYSTTLSSWNLSLQQTLTANIGSANYDIGHMFGATGGGGNAGCIGCVCVDPATSTSKAKGSGITSPADGIPKGDNFDIDYVIHEMGHQLGANHTFSQSNEGTGVQKEIGSGITIMGYAGITGYDLAPHSIDIFHEASIAQIQTNMASKSCPVTTNISANNATPVLSAVLNRTIPISTPFALTGVATDADGDPLTYCWEQNDNSSTTGTGSNASVTKTTGPNWISFVPTVSPVRYFPKLATILVGGQTTKATGNDAAMLSEALSSVGRTLNFRLTVRDNAPYSSSAPIQVGQTAFTDVVVTVSATSGPFAVTVPNTNVTYVGGSTQTVTWNVNNTTLSPVSCANVKISFSNDGGNTFPFVLAATTPNDGSAPVVIPVGLTTTARMKVEAVGNIFFDISNANFTVTAPLPVRILSFTAQKDRGIVRLTWQTSEEANIKIYSIEKSVDGIMFKSISTMGASGNGRGGINTYNAVDVDPSTGKNFYRILEVDNDGKTTYSLIREVAFDKTAVPVFTYSNSSAVDINVPAGKVYDVRLLTSTGQEITSLRNLNQTHTSLNLGNVAVGMYIVNVYYDNQVFHFKLVK